MLESVFSFAVRRGQVSGLRCQKAGGPRDRGTRERGECGCGCGCECECGCEWTVCADLRSLTPGLWFRCAPGGGINLQGNGEKFWGEVVGWAVLRAASAFSGNDLSSGLSYPSAVRTGGDGAPSRIRFSRFP